MSDILKLKEEYLKKLSENISLENKPGDKIEQEDKNETNSDIEKYKNYLHKTGDINVSDLRLEMQMVVELLLHKIFWTLLCCPRSSITQALNLRNMAQSVKEAMFFSHLQITLAILMWSGILEMLLQLLLVKGFLINILLMEHILLQFMFITHPAVSQQQHKKLWLAKATLF